MTFHDDGTPDHTLGELASGAIGEAAQRNVLSVPADAFHDVRGVNACGESPL